MVWDVYTIFALLTGVMLLGLAATPLFTRKERWESVGFGVLILGYGAYIGQTDGSFVFPLWFFAFPFIFVAVALRGVYERWTTSQAHTSAPDAADPYPAEPAGAAEPVAAAAPAAAPAASGTTSHTSGAFAPGAAVFAADGPRPFLYAGVERP